MAGLGNVGQAIGLHLLESGWTVSALDKNRDRVSELVQHGAREVDAAGLAGSPSILFVVPDDTAIREILDAGLLTELSGRHTVLVVSTVLPERTKELAEQVHETGAAYVDLPISGGAERARRGELTLFVGGSDEVISRADALLAELGSRRFVLGEAGTASATKLAHQLVLFSTLAGLYEALRLTGAFGIDDEVALGAVNGGLAESWVGRNWGFYDRLNDDYDDAGVPADDRPWAKDLREVVETSVSLGFEAPLAGVLAEMLPAVVAEHAAASKEGAAR